MSDFRVVPILDGRQVHKLARKFSAKGHPLCINCGKTVPKVERRYKKDVFFCTSLCASRYAAWVAKQIYEDVPESAEIKTARRLIEEGSTEWNEFCETSNHVPAKAKHVWDIVNDFAKWLKEN